jgi:sn-glycerol 3-phosphate transport system ATP-binding protein
MPAIQLESIEKRWGETIAVKGINLAAEEGRFLVLLGPSGCGKSTTLRIIAGLESPSRGRVWINGIDVTHAPPSDRHLSMVFQSYALFPHLNTEENILFGLKVRKVPAAERQQRLKKVAELVGLADYLDRKPAQLSGGQRQRVALARAVIAENPICLMDEPLSNLDAKLRHDMRVEIRSLQCRLGMTVVYVTHDQTEAMSMADKVILMHDGTIEQEGTPGNLYDNPASTFTARFVGTPPMNLLRITSDSRGVLIEGTESLVQSARPDSQLGVRPEHITIDHRSGIPATLKSADYLGADTIVTAAVGSQQVMIRIPGRYTVNEQEQVFLRWLPESARLFDNNSGLLIDDNPVLSAATG